MLTIWLTRQTFWCLIVYWQRQLRYSNCVKCPSLWLLETRGLWRAEQWCLLQHAQSPDTQHCQLFQYFTWFIAFLMGQDWAATLMSRISLQFTLSSWSGEAFCHTFYPLLAHFIEGAGRLSNLLLLPFKLCRIAMWKVTPAHYKSFIVRFKYFNAKWVAWKGSIHFKDNTSQTIKQYHNSVAEIKFKSLINKMIKW